MDDLTKFAQWFLKSSTVIAGVPLHGAVTKIEDVTSVLMYRDPPYQVQMFIVPPNYIIPEHTHPNVDSYEVYMGGQIRFSHAGKWVVTEDEFTNADDKDMPKAAGRTIRVKPDDLHGGVFGPSGGVFLSIQHWLNGVQPHCVAADYNGVVMGPHHQASVKYGQPVLKDHLTAQDAASAEQTPMETLAESLKQDNRLVL